MEIEMGLNPNCSEAVFRFYTVDPKQIQAILQALADEVSANSDFGGHKEQKIPLFTTAQEYDSGFHRLTEEESEAQAKKRAGERAKGKEVPADWHTYKRVLFYACEGLGDNACSVTIEQDRGAFVLNIGNNDISENTTKWVEKVVEMGIKVEEAEFSPSLNEKYARDCTCGITFFEGQPNLIREAEHDQKEVIPEGPHTP
jgi:hypothetical protein